MNTTTDSINAAIEILKQEHSIFLKNYTYNTRTLDVIDEIFYYLETGEITFFLNESVDVGNWILD